MGLREEILEQPAGSGTIYWNSSDLLLIEIAQGNQRSRY